jgi:ribosomal protein S18 acetylase RimI-like enzyme
MALDISTDVDRVDWYELVDVIERAPLGKREAAVIERAFRGSYLCCFVYDTAAGSKLVGAGRAISDGATHSAIFDLVVLPEYQGQGLGKLILEFLLERLPEHNVMLVSVPAKIPFYEKHGFQRLRTGMARVAYAAAWEERGHLAPRGEPLP